MTKETIFDSYSKDYSSVHDQYLPAGVSREQFFAQKFNWTCMRWQMQVSPKVLIDFGCNHGELSQAFTRAFPAAKIFGIDESSAALAEAKKNLGTSATSAVTYLERLDQIETAEKVDLITAYNVLHHVPPPERAQVLHDLSQRLGPGAEILIWEHNRFNPLTRYLVKICPFDVGVVLTRPKEIKKMLEASGLIVQKFEYINLLPPNFHAYKLVAWLEKLFARIPLGAQYRMIAKRPA